MSIKKNDVLKFAVFIIIIATAVTFIALNLDHLKHIDSDTIIESVRKKGALSVLIYLLIFALKPFVMVMPSNIVVMSGAAIFGPFKGLMLAMVGFFISATVAFYVSRFLGKDFVQGIIGKKFMSLDKKIENSGFKIIFLIRLIPVIPYDPVSYASGFTNMKYFTYIIPSVLGVLPETFCYCIMGENASNPLSAQFLLPLVLIAVVALLSNKFFNLDKINKK